jgi:5-formyltetrahydrofolate cyclo-ligase
VSLKSELRTSGRAFRALQPIADHRAVSHLLDMPELMTAVTISAYWGVDHEPAPQNIFTELLHRGIRTLLPIVNRDWSLDWGLFEGEESLVERRGLWEPKESLGPNVIHDADVLITPGLRVDRRGVRLGQGAGCYDRALALAADEAWVVVLLHDGEISDELIPEEPHDRRVNAASTPSGLIRFASHLA